MQYVLVSQGLEIYRTFDRQEALRIKNDSNKKWLYYKQSCIERCEPYVDNEVFMYEEE